MNPVIAVKGMNDLFPAEVARWQQIEATFRRVVGLAGYGEIRVPIVEHTPLYVRSVGEGTDIVDKEMYSFTFHDEAMTIRPEGTAGVVRAFVEHKMYSSEPLARYAYLGPMFRGERPARGRYRQFHQAGCEAFGDAGPGIDAEMIAMLVDFLREVGAEGITVALNSIGDRGAKARYRDALVAYLEPHKEKLSADSQRRLSTNPLRILDSKNPDDQVLVQEAPSVFDVLDDADRAHFDQLQAMLQAMHVPFACEPRLVRGLDYYTRTLFEVRCSNAELGAQTAIAGGGRYDHLVSELGGPDTPAIGFAIGLERLLIATKALEVPPPFRAFIAPLGARAIEFALTLAQSLRQAGIATIADTRGGSMKSMLRRADSLQSKVAIVLGDRELDAHVAQVKDLQNHTQSEMPLADLLVRLTELTKVGRPE
jgi:histidyl-tRNA synthetase